MILPDYAKLHSTHTEHVSLADMRSGNPKNLMLATIENMVRAQENCPQRTFELGLPDYYCTFCMDSPYAWVRGFDVTTLEWSQDTDGYWRITVPLTSKSHKEIKQGSRIVFDPNTIVINWSATFPGPNTSMKDRRRAFTQYAVQQAVMNVIRYHAPEKTVYIGENDVIVDGRKIYGGQATGNFACYFLAGSVQYDIDANRFAYEMQFDKNHQNSTRVRSAKEAEYITLSTGEQVFTSMTTVREELPNLSKSEFIEHLHKEFETMYRMAI